MHNKHYLNAKMMAASSLIGQVDLKAKTIMITGFSTFPPIPTLIVPLLELD